MVAISTSQVVPWVDDMTRRHAGVKNRAEWIAPPPIQEQVKRDYLAFYRYATQTLPQGWVAYGHGLSRYLCDDMLQQQRESLNMRLEHDRGRLVDILRASHEVHVRNFSSDGMRCIVIDQQSEQRMATYDYWNGDRLHTQDLGSTVYIYVMRYDAKQERWRIAKHIQQFIPNTCQPISVELTAPPAIGRDS